VYFNDERCLLGRAQQAKHPELVEAFPIASPQLRLLRVVLVRPTECFITRASIIHFRALRVPVCRTKAQTFFFERSSLKSFSKVLRCKETPNFSWT